MKLRAAVSHGPLLRDVCGVFATLSKTCTMMFDPEGVQIHSIVNQGALQLWAEPIPAHKLFSAYLCMSNVDSNAISFDINVDLLYKSFIKMGTEALESDMAIRLSKEHQTAYFSVSFDVNPWGEATKVTQKLPLQLIRDTSRDTEPQLPNADIYFSLPDPVASLHRLVDRYKFLSSYVTLSASKDGRLVLSMDDESDNITGVKVSSTWENVKIMHDPEQGDNGDGQFSVRVSTKDFGTILQAVSLGSKVVLGIIDRQVLMLLLRLGDETEGVTFTYYLSNHDE